MTALPSKVTLDEKETALFLPVSESLDAYTQGVNAGMQAAKQILLAQLLKQRKVSDGTDKHSVQANEQPPNDAGSASADGGADHATSGSAAGTAAA